MSKARSLNRATLIGNLTADPKTEVNEEGAMVCVFTLATNTSWKNKEGEEETQTQFHRLVCFNKLAEICSQLLSKGAKIFAEGEIRYKKIEREDGGYHYKTDIKLDEVILIDKKNIEELHK